MELTNLNLTGSGNTYVVGFGPLFADVIKNDDGKILVTYYSPSGARITKNTALESFNDEDKKKILDKIEEAKSMLSGNYSMKSGIKKFSRVKFKELSKKNFSVPDFLDKTNALIYLLAPFTAAVDVNHGIEDFEILYDELEEETGLFNENLQLVADKLQDAKGRIDVLDDNEKAYIDDLVELIRTDSLPVMYSVEFTDFDVVMEESEFDKLQKFIKDHGKECWDGTFEGLTNPAVVPSIDGITKEDVFDDEYYEVKQELVRPLIGDDTQEWHIYWRTKEGPHPQSAPSIL